MEIAASRWRKYGHDRTYLTDAETGTRLGYLDNLTGTLHVEADGALLDLETWMAHQPSDHSTRPALLDTEPAAETALTDAPDWHDLSENRAGQAARAQADAHLEDMRGRSKFWTGVARVLDVKTDERAWRVGAKGEETVGTRLDRLTEHGWHVLHAVPVGERGSDIDHLLVGPGGVWTINTKNHPGKKIWVSPKQVRVDGHVQPYLRNSEFEADRVRKILTEHLGWEPFVKAGLVFLTGTLVPDVTIKAMPDNVLILDRMDIPRVFRKSPERLTPEGIAEVFEIARRSTTWTRLK